MGGKWILKNRAWSEKKKIHPDFSLNDDWLKVWLAWWVQRPGALPIIQSSSEGLISSTLLSAAVLREKPSYWNGWLAGYSLAPKGCWSSVHNHPHRKVSMAVFAGISTSVYLFIYLSIYQSINLSIYLFLCIGRSTQIRKRTKDFCMMTEMNILLPSSQCLSCSNAERWTPKNVLPSWWTTRG